jgi:hypothetical protein
MRPFLLFALSAFAVGSALAANTTAFDDPVGDAAAGQADIGRVTAASNDTSTVTFRVPVSNPGTNRIVLSLDTDDSTATGHADGIDAELVLRFATGAFHADRWVGDRFVPMPALRASGRLEGGEAVLSLNARDFELGPSVRFVLATFTEADTRSDVAPDGGLEGTPWRFRPEIRPAIAAVRLQFTPARAGTTVALRSAELRLADGSTSHPSSTSCTARLGGAALKGSRCAFRLPVNARGKLVRITVRVALDPQRVASRTVALRVL